MQFYSVTRKGSVVVVRARDVAAKQVLWGWAGGGLAAELYGRGAQRGIGGDREIWEWQLSSAGVAEMLRGLAKRNYFNDYEWKRAAELQKKLQKQVVTGGGKKRRSAKLAGKEHAAASALALATALLRKAMKD